MVTASALRQLAALRTLEAAPEQAVELYRQSIAFEDSPEARMNLALVGLSAAQPDESISQTSHLLQLDPKNSRLWFIKGKAQMAKADYQAATESFKSALQIKKDVNAQYALGYSLLMLKQKARAETAFKQMIADYGDKAIWHVVFGGAYRDSKYPDDAIREFRRAIAMDPKAPRAQFFLGLTLLEQNHWAQSEESMVAFRAAALQDPKDYFANFYLGAGESELKLFDSSNRHLKIALESQPNIPEIWLYLGLNMYQQQNYAEAKAYLLKAVKLTGDDEGRSNYQIRRAYIALGRMEFIAGNKVEADKWAERARDLQNKSLANSAEFIAETMAAGGVQHAAGVMPQMKVPKQQAISNIDPSASLEPTAAGAAMSAQELAEAKDYEKKLHAILSSALNDWGTSEARQGQYAEAIERFHEAEKWDASTPGLMRNIGIAALKVNDTAEAMRALSAAVEVDPQDKAARSRLALTLFRSNQYQEAAKQFSLLGAEAAADPTLGYAWSYSLAKIKDTRKASEVLNQVTPQVSSPESLVSIGDLYSVLEDYEHAVSAYKRAIELDPKIARARYKMGAALIRLDRPDQAIAPLREELRTTADDADVQYNLAYALLQTSHKDEALTLLRSIIAAHPEHAQAQYQMGKVLLDQGQSEQAIHHLESAVEHDPDQDYIHYQLQTAYRKVGRKEDADRELAVYRDMKAKKREKASIPQPERSQ